ncbi:MAG: thioredoxin [Betaproteobacteria bacterium]
MMDVTVENFEQEVMASSMQTPVLLDFWAPWCGPCKTIGPMLEKLEEDYQGRFKLVKINSDDEQQLAGAFGIKSIPTCILVKEGRPVDGFMGALPEGKLKEFLDKHLPSIDELIAQEDAQEAQELLQEGNDEQALVKLQEALAMNPASEDTRYDYAKLLIKLGELQTAEMILAPSLTQIPLQLRFDALHHWLECLKFMQTSEKASWRMEQFDEHLALNKRDFETRLAKARCLVASGALTQAMDELLEIVMRDKLWSDQVARKLFVSILELMTPVKTTKSQAQTPKAEGAIELAGHVPQVDDPQAELISKYRRKLSMALN